MAWFTFDPAGRHPDVALSRDNSSATCDSFENRVALASVRFARGTHYWEFSVDKFDGNADPAFGMARADVSRDCMLGERRRRAERRRARREGSFADMLFDSLSS